MSEKILASELTGEQKARMSELPDVVSVEEALRRSSLSIRVPDREEMTVGPFSAQPKSFQLAEIRNFKDLHRLGFVADQISEEHAVQALRADERAHREAVRQGAGATCSCDAAEGSLVRQPLRRRFQDSLIEILQPLYRQSLTADDPAVVHPFRRLQAWLERPSIYLIGICVLKDIDIGKSATLTMTPTVRALYANNINIGDFGRLHFQSGNVHVRCASLSGPEVLFQVNKHIPGLDRELLEVRQ